MVRHFVGHLVADMGLEELARPVSRPLSGFVFSPHYGCHYIKPRQAATGLDDPFRPRTLHELVRLTGAQAADDPNSGACCGGGLLGLDEPLANRLALDRLGSARRTDGLVLICPFCNVMLEGQQKKIAKQHDAELSVPVFFYPQILGLAYGLTPDELGFKLNRIKNKRLLEAFA